MAYGLKACNCHPLTHSEHWEGSSNFKENKGRRIKADVNITSSELSKEICLLDVICPGTYSTMS